MSWLLTGDGISALTAGVIAGVVVAIAALRAMGRTAAATELENDAKTALKVLATVIVGVQKFRGASLGVELPAELPDLATTIRDVAKGAGVEDKLNPLVKAVTDGQVASTSDLLAVLRQAGVTPPPPTGPKA